MKVNFGNIIDNKSLHLPFSLAPQSCSTSKVKFFVVKQQKKTLVRTRTFHSRHFEFNDRDNLYRQEPGISTTTQKKCKWNKINRLKRSNRSKRTTFLSRPFIPVIFSLGRPKMCVPFIFHSELPESLCQW